MQISPGHIAPNRTAAAFGLLLSFILAMNIGLQHARADFADTVIFGGEANYPPFEWLEEGVPTGFNVDLAAAIAQSGQAQYEYRMADWPEVIRWFQSGQVDVVAMFRSTEREKFYDFSPAFHSAHHAIYSARGKSPVFRLEDLQGRSIATEESSYAHQRLVEEGIEAELSLVGNGLEALQMVSTGRVEYALLAAHSSDLMIRVHNLPLQRSGPPIWPREYAFAVRKGRPELAAWLNEHVAKIISSGRHEEIYRDWEDRLTAGDDRLTIALRNAVIIVMPLLLMVALGFGWSWSLRRTVRARTRALETELQLRRAAEGKLSHAANHSALTGLPEPHHFIATVDSWLADRETSPTRQREMLVLKLTELDKIAWTLGYDIANQFLRGYAARIQAAGYVACGYLGRGVFAVFSDGRPLQDDPELLSNEVEANGVRLHPEIMYGLAYWPNHGTTAEALVRRAETALAVCVRRNQRSAVFDPPMEPDLHDLQIVRDFRASRGRDLYAVFQPQVDLDRGELVGAEALVRWQHPELGLIPPTKFIPLLESTGLIGMVTELMIREAIRVGARLRRLGQPCPISVNVSANDFTRTDLPAVIDKELAAHAGDPRDLKLELTETSVAEDPQHVRLALTRLNAAGIHAAIDDFGTGHSSLSYLSSFPIHEIKIDRSFVDGMTSSPRNRAIVRSTIYMAHALGVLVIAEGAEDQATVEALRADRCDRVQGYVISRPLHESDWFRFVEQYNTKRVCRASQSADQLP